MLHSLSTLKLKCASCKCYLIIFLTVSFFLFPPSISTFGNDGFLKMELQLFAWLVHTEIKINEVRFIILNINNF